MSKIVLMSLQCEAFVFIPLITFGLGLKFIISRLGFKHRFSSMAIAIVIGIVFFEASLIGMLIDPRSISVSLIKLIEIAGLIGFTVFVLILLFGPIYQRLLQIFRP